MTKAADKPESFSIWERDIRRANLRRFPYHFLFRVVGHEVRILIIRHHHRHPSLDPGVDRDWPSRNSVAWSGLGLQS